MGLFLQEYKALSKLQWHSASLWADSMRGFLEKHSPLAEIWGLFGSKISLYSYVCIHTNTRHFLRYGVFCESKVLLCVHIGLVCRSVGLFCRDISCSCESGCWRLVHIWRRDVVLYHYVIIGLLCGSKRHFCGNTSDYLWKLALETCAHLAQWCHFHARCRCLC